MSKHNYVPCHVSKYEPKKYKSKQAKPDPNALILPDPEPSKVPAHVMTYAQAMDHSRMMDMYNSIDIVGLNSGNLRYSERIDGWIESILDKRKQGLQGEDDSATKIVSLYKDNKIPVMVDSLFLGNIIRVTIHESFITGEKRHHYQFQIVYTETVENLVTIKGLSMCAAKNVKVGGVVGILGNKPILDLVVPFTTKEIEREVMI